MTEPAELVAQMSLEEKASLLNGADFWHTVPVERLGIPQITVSDGPHGLRKVTDDGSSSHPATCFPAAATAACTFDRKLMYEVGTALGEECRAQDVDVLLGPGINIKRNPLCGRNFEYFSEDPYLAGELASAWVKGVQSQEVGTSLKHYAANNQEARRMTIGSVVDERALREIYLSAFERVVTSARPWTVMSSYNRVLTDWQGDGAPEYASENGVLLSDILRERFGFEGVVVSDWGAVSDPIKSIQAGLDLRMPGVGPSAAAAIVEAVRQGRLSEEDVDRAATRILQLVEKAVKRKPAEFTEQMQAAHHEIARRAALEGAVLLKNEGGVLPLVDALPVEEGGKGKHLVVIGAFAKTPRYQGGGSSHVNPAHLVSACDALDAAGVSYTYAPGYDPTSLEADQQLIEEACQLAEDADQVVLFVGLPEVCESEGYDRESLQLPPSQARLIKALTLVKANLVVVLSCGSPVDMSWESGAQAILLAGLGGQAGGEAVVDLLLGKENPSGRLAESWPVAYDDTPSSESFPGFQKTVEYRESIYVGYRYYDTAASEVRYPFGYGLSYTNFEYGTPHVNHSSIIAGDKVTVSVDVANTGNRAGAEVVQLYVSKLGREGMGPEQELKGFERVYLEPGQKRIVNFHLDRRSFAYYNVDCHDWCVETGVYVCRLGSASRAIRAAVKVDVVSTDPRVPALIGEAASAYTGQVARAKMTETAFQTLLGRPLPARERKEGEPYTLDSTLGEIRQTRIGAKIFDKAVEAAASQAGSVFDMSGFEKMLVDMPLRSASMAEDDRVSPRRIEGLLDILNGHFLKGIFKAIRK